VKQEAAGILDFLDTSIQIFPERLDAREEGHIGRKRRGHARDGQACKGEGGRPIERVV
jgi:hypothetical protein